MPVISMGSINIPAADVPILSAAFDSMIESRVDETDFQAHAADPLVTSVPNNDPSSWTPKQKLQYLVNWGPPLMTLMPPVYVPLDADVIVATDDSATKGATFDTARTEHNDAGVVLKDARGTALAAAEVTVTGFALT